jgi:hypothetical protein
MLMNSMKQMFLFCYSRDFIAHVLFESTTSDMFQIHSSYNYSGKRIVLEHEIYRITSRLYGKLAFSK